MKKFTHSLIVLLTLSLSACVALITPKVESDLVKLKSGQYALDKRHASLLFKVQHLGLSTYVGRFNSIDASLKFDPANIAATKLDVIVDIGSLDINDSSLASDLMGRSWFNQAAHPQAVFTTLAVKPLSEQEFEFSGSLKLRGVEKPIVVTAVFHGGANNILTGKYTLGFSATGSFLRSDFGMDAYIPLVGDEIKFEAFAEFQKN